MLETEEWKSGWIDCCVSIDNNITRYNVCKHVLVSSIATSGVTLILFKSSRVSLQYVEHVHKLCMSAIK